MGTLDVARFTADLGRAFKENGIGGLLSHERTLAFARLTERMLEENEKYNLTAIREPEKIALLHYADCATLSAMLPKGASVIDVGCGAGFPTLPLAILRPDLSILAVDSTEKRVRYVEETARLLGLENVTARTMRAEDGAKDPLLREHFDVACARAVAEMRILCELCLPFVRVGGEMIAMKGRQAAHEVQGAKKAISLLGGRLLSVDETPLHSSTLGEMGRGIVRIRKERKTPADYPRAYAQISKKPL